MTKIVLSDDESALLQGYLKTSHLVLIRLKCQVVLMRSRNIALKDIGFVVSKNKQTIGRWIKDFCTRRMASIFTGHKNNQNAGKLTKTQKEEIREALKKPPSEYGIPKIFWDVPALKEYVKATFDTVYESDQSYHFLLAFSRLSFKYPDTFDRRRDEELIVKRMQEIRIEMTPLLQNPACEVFCSDEVRIELEAITRRAWLRKGERTIVKVNRKREAQSYIGFLNQKSFACHLFEMDWQNQDEVLKAFELFLKEYPEKRICIVWDNAGFHKGSKIREALKRGGLLERVHLIPMPPYAPDHNPIEHVWKEAKGASANQQKENLDETKKAFSDYIGGRTFAYQI